MNNEHAAAPESSGISDQHACDVANVAAAVRLQGISKAYPTAGQPLRVLQDLDLSLDAGQSVAVVGPSGSGKSTLLNLLGALDRPDSGTMMINGQDPFELTDKELAGFRNHHIGFVFQDHHLLPQLTVIENVLVPALAAGKPSSDQISQALELLSAVGLADRCGHLPSELSGGERERVAIARSLLMQPSLILADEPTGNLDRRTADGVTELLLDLQARRGAILVCVTHSDSLAAAMGQQFRLEDGRLIMS